MSHQNDNAAVRRQVWRIGTLIGLHGLVVKLIDVASTTGVVAHSGATGLAQIWGLDVLLTLALGTLLATYGDRWPRARLLSWTLIAATCGYAAVALALWSGVSRLGCYWALYLLSTAEVALVPVTAWAIAADTLQGGHTLKWFGRIAIGESVADLSGYGLAAVVNELSGTGMDVDAKLVMASAAVCALGAILAVRGLPLVMGTAAGRPAPLAEALTGHGWVKPLAVRVGLQYAVWVILGWAAIADLERATGSDSKGFRRWYAIYSVGSTLLILVGQSVMPQWLQRTDRRRASLLMPGLLMAACAAATLVPDPRVTMPLLAMYFFVSYTWDAPLRRATFADVPERVRGRVAALIDVQSYAIGSLLGTCLILAGDRLTPDTDGRRWLTGLAAGLAVIQLVVARRANLLAPAIAAKGQ